MARHEHRTTAVTSNCIGCSPIIQLANDAGVEAGAAADRAPGTYDALLRPYGVCSFLVAVTLLVIMLWLTAGSGRDLRNYRTEHAISDLRNHSHIIHLLPATRWGHMCVSLPGTMARIHEVDRQFPGSFGKPRPFSPHHERPRPGPRPLHMAGSLPRAGLASAAPAACKSRHDSPIPDLD